MRKNLDKCVESFRKRAHLHQHAPVYALILHAFGTGYFLDGAIEVRAEFLRGGGKLRPKEEAEAARGFIRAALGYRGGMFPRAIEDGGGEGQWGPWYGRPKARTRRNKWEKRAKSGRGS